MNLKKITYFIFGFFQMCYSTLFYTDPDYNGKHFSDKYLEPEFKTPTRDNFRHYLKTLKRTVFYFYRLKNDTNINGCLGNFYMKSILKRTIRDYGNQLNKNERYLTRKIINYGEDIVSHCLYPIKIDAEVRKTLFSKVLILFKNDDPQVYSIEDFNKNKLGKWLRSNITVNFLAKRFDTLNMTRDEFIKTVHIQNNSYLTERSSDFCLSRIGNNPESINFSNLHKCIEDHICFKIMHTSPSVSYYLSHRLFYLMFLHHTKRCYLYAKDMDDIHRDVLCAFMYREVVYIIRKGFFYRDLLLEHVALCGVLGYLEFHRSHWFNRMASWQDRHGCVAENHNTYINRTQFEAERNNDSHEVRSHTFKKRFSSCHIHAMSLFVVVMAHAVRYAAFGVSREINA